MPLNSIPINPQGGNVKIEIVFGYAQVGAYTLLLWNKTGDGYKRLGEGMNTDNIPDEFTLPKPSKSHVGKILDCLATVISPKPEEGSRYRIDMIVRQDGQECGRESYEGTISTKSVSVRLAAVLSAQS